MDRTYLVCATPRSGSTLLCEALKATGVAGRPEEYFESVVATGRPAPPPVLPRAAAGDLRSRRHRWMAETDDSLLDGPVPPPPGAWANAPDQISAGDRVSAGSVGEDRSVERPGGLRHGTPAR